MRDLLIDPVSPDGFKANPVMTRRLASLGLFMYQRRTIWAKIKQTIGSGFMSTGSVSAINYNINSMALRNVFEGGIGIVWIHAL